MKLIGVYDTTAGPLMPYTDIDHQSFCYDIVQLAKEFDEFHYILKKKNYGGFTIHGPNIRTIEPFTKPTTSTIISQSMLTVSLAFTSPTVEAWGAGRLGMYYDPTDKYKDGVYDKYPMIVAHNYDQLREYFKFWTTTPDPDTLKVIRKELDIEKTDGITQFRRLLIK